MAVGPPWVFRVTSSESLKLYFRRKLSNLFTYKGFAGCRWSPKTTGPPSCLLLRAMHGTTAAHGARLEEPSGGRVLPPARLLWSLSLLLAFLLFLLVLLAALVLLLVLFTAGAFTVRGAEAGAPRKQSLGRPRRRAGGLAGSSFLQRGVGGSI